VRAALQGAASIAGLMITTEAMVAESPKREATPAHPHDHHPHPGDMDF
jgi:chaperonin GroEL